MVGKIAMKKIGPMKDLSVKYSVFYNTKVF